jgi:hypothetical protein
MANGTWRDRSLPELLLGLVVIGIALVVTGFVVADAIRDVKQSRDTIKVTGSARQPITANLVNWSLAVDAKNVRPEDATRLLRTRVNAVRAFLREGGVPDSAITQPPVSTEETTIRQGGLGFRHRPLGAGCPGLRRRARVHLDAVERGSHPSADQGDSERTASSGDDRQGDRRRARVGPKRIARRVPGHAPELDRCQ